MSSRRARGGAPRPVLGRSWKKTDFASAQGAAVVLALVINSTGLAAVSRILPP
jgi:hypothetical protein